MPVFETGRPRRESTGERHERQSRLGRLFGLLGQSGTRRPRWFLVWSARWQCPGCAASVDDGQCPLRNVVSVTRPRPRHNRYRRMWHETSAPAVTAATFSTLIGLARSARNKADGAAVPADPAVFVSGVGGMLPESPLLSRRRSSIRYGLDNSRSESHAIPTCPEDRARFTRECCVDSNKGTVSSLAMERS